MSKPTFKIQRNRELRCKNKKCSHLLGFSYLGDLKEKSKKCSKCGTTNTFIGAQIVYDENDTFQIQFGQKDAGTFTAIEFELTDQQKAAAKRGSNNADLTKFDT